ncbi:MAG: helix-turn-helix transcriptional regulator [Atopobiaceae bacterium]|nr:helix-turn-helix transcriptional regulator [Atopobiaceae bacterium]MBR3314711.1 helix-turn-helix transcriptional regulator [Atopobiaceae bacterium]
MVVIHDTSDKRLLYKSRHVAIGQLLKELREERQLKQIDIAQVAGLGQSDVSKVESGERSIRFVEVDLYAHALGIDVGTLAKTMFETMWANDNAHQQSFDTTPDE